MTVSRREGKKKLKTIPIVPWMLITPLEIFLTWELCLATGSRIDPGNRARLGKQGLELGLQTASLQSVYCKPQRLKEGSDSKARLSTSFQSCKWLFSHIHTNTNTQLLNSEWCIYEEEEHFNNCTNQITYSRLTNNWGMKFHCKPEDRERWDPWSDRSLGWGSWWSWIILRLEALDGMSASPTKSIKCY